MFEVAICWLCSVFMRDKCHIAQSYSPPRPCKWHFPASSTWDTCKCNYYSRRILISHQILNLQPLRKSKTAEKTPGYLKWATSQFLIIHHQSVNKKSIILFLELISWPPQKTPNYSISVIKGCDLTEKTQGRQRAEEIWDSGHTASSPLSRPCRPELLIIYHSALIGPSRVLWKQLPTSALGLNTDTDVHLGEHKQRVATFSIYIKG